MAQLEFECRQHEGGMASLQGNYCAIPASLLGLLPSFHLELSFSNSDRRREKDSYSVSSIWTQGSRSSLPSQLILSVLGTCGSGEMSCLRGLLQWPQRHAPSKCQLRGVGPTCILLIL